SVLNTLYAEAIQQEHLKPVSQPEVNVTKFVPFTTLEFTLAVDVVGKIKLGDYKKVKVARKADKVTDKDVDAVMQDLLARDAEKKEVKRAAKDGDEVVIDFAGVDAKSKEAIEGGSGTDYPLTLGSNTFIPGFEPELVGLKAGDEKTFTVTFPKDYGAKELQGKKVEFTVTVKRVQEVVLPKADNAFAAKLGPFKSVDELKADITKQIQLEKDRQVQQQLENDILGQLAEKSTAEIPDALIEQEMDRMDEDEKRNLIYRGQTWQEHLDAEGKTEEQHREGQREQATLRVKTGLVLGEVAEIEGVQVSQDELNQRIAELKKQYEDGQMRAELDKVENQRDIYGRLLTEKTIATLVGYATK
ncbi:trigger factor, partial [Candidatus Saccharibacteria bacterium]|nr:trigger factor [Candidatus Saccharibacteria bacterium]